MINVALVVAAFGLLAGALGRRKTQEHLDDPRVQTAFVLLFLVTGLIQPHPVQAYYHWVVAGLVGGLIGDVFLALKGNRAFRAGLISFLLGHILYIVAFAGLTRLPDWLSLGQVFIASLSLGVFWWLRPHVGSMMVPVILYVVAITLMVAAAWSAFLNPGLNSQGAWALLIGAVCFYASDLFVARDRFVEEPFHQSAVRVTALLSRSVSHSIFRGIGSIAVEFRRKKFIDIKSCRISVASDGISFTFMIDMRPELQGITQRAPLPGIPSRVSLTIRKTE